MTRKKESFRWKIFTYNIMLMTFVALGASMYILLNDETIRGYNQTFTAYSKLNHFYKDVQRINDSYTRFFSSGNVTILDEIEDIKTEGFGEIKEIKKGLNKKEQAQFDKLKQMLLELSTVVNTHQVVQNDWRVNVHNQYLDIMRTRGDYYEIVTQNMQQYKVQIQNSRNYLGWMSIVLVGFMIFWIYYFSRAMLRSITNPIETIVHNMNQIKRGEYDLTQISNINEEMSVLCLALDDMARNVEKNIQYANEKAELEKRVLEQQNENLRKDELLVQGELRILQNQINPHFLFNTLNMIYKKAYSEGAFESAELMEKTSKLLRYSLDNMNKVSSLREELSAVENYMYIQDKRFGERISFKMKVAQAIENIQMPTMVLQPLVENAVVHGLKDTMENGEVIVSAQMEEDEIVLSVSDNGLGISAEQLESLVLNDYRVCDHEREHIGLYSVTKRLKAFYGNQIEIIVNSAKECGFEIVFRIKGRR